MRTVFHAKLINPPLGDPGLYVTMPDERRAMLFDCGQLDGLSARELLRLTDIFVSHTHVDHWIGFDRVLRVLIGRARQLRMFGPAGFIDQVACKVHAYTWNLVHRYEAVLSLIVVELHGDGTVRLAKLSSDAGFEPGEVFVSSCGDGVLLEEARLAVRAVVLDHRTPCLAFALSENGHIGVRKNELESMGLPTGAWLRELKRAVRAGAPGDTVFRAWWRDDEGQTQERFVPLRELRGALEFSRGQKLCYVVDARFDETNAHRIVELCEGADQLFIEAPFLHREQDHAFERYHLTAHQAGLLARRARVQRLTTFHYSPRHEHELEALEAEARHAFEHGAWIAHAR